MKGKNDPTKCLPAKIKNKYIYKKEEQESIVNVGTIKQEIDDDKLDR